MDTEIKALRKQLGITQQELATKLKVSISTIQKWESKENKPSKLARRQIDRLQRRKKL